MMIKLCFAALFASTFFQTGSPTSEEPFLDPAIEGTISSLGCEVISRETLGQGYVERDGERSDVPASLWGSTVEAHCANHRHLTLEVARRGPWLNGIHGVRFARDLPELHEQTGYAMTQSTRQLPDDKYVTSTVWSPRHGVQYRLSLVTDGSGHLRGPDADEISRSEYQHFVEDVMALVDRHDPEAE